MNGLESPKDESSVKKSKLKRLVREKLGIESLNELQLKSTLGYHFDESFIPVADLLSDDETAFSN
jgi:hypothetical protein